MDMRHYDLVAHGLAASYEDVQPGMSTAFGVARTSELTLYPSAAGCPPAPTPSRRRKPAATAPVARRLTGLHPLHRCLWRVESAGSFDAIQKARSRKGSMPCWLSIEKQVDSRRWYGFWQFGDFMHSYSAARHVWHYDWGGHAWDNTELGAPLWLWYSFLRTGRASVSGSPKPTRATPAKPTSIQSARWPDSARATTSSSGAADQRKPASVSARTGGPITT